MSKVRLQSLRFLCVNNMSTLIQTKNGKFVLEDS
jgi:hypothetical protein